MVGRRFLVVQLRQLGDILLTTPCVRAIKAANAADQVTVLTHTMGRLVLEGNPDVDEHLVYSERDSLLQQLSLLGRLRRRFDVVLDFMNNPRSALYTLASRAPLRVGFHSARRYFYTRTVARRADRDREEYIVRTKFRLLREVGVDAACERLRLPWAPSDAELGRRFISAHPDLEKAPRRVVLSPTHRRSERRWRLSAYAQLARELVSRWDAAIVWIWGPGEEPLIDEVRQLAGVPTFKAPKTTFREMAALLAQCDFFVGNSNGPSHVAVALDVPSFQIHGPTSPQAWCPLTARHQALGSSPRRLEELPVSEVLDALVAMQPTIFEQAQGRRQMGWRLDWRR